MAVEAEEPGGIFVCGKRVFLPGLVGEAEGNVVREAVVFQQQAYAAAVGRLVAEIGAAPVDDLVGTLGEHGLVAHFLGHAGDVVVVDELCVAEGSGRHAKVLFDKPVVDPDLLLPFLWREEKGQGMGVGF